MIVAKFLRASLLASAVAAFITAGAAFAQTPTPTPATPTPSVPPPAATMPAPTVPPTAAVPAPGAVPAVKRAARPKSERSPESLACSADADQKGLKGAERRNFRRQCMSAAKKAAAPVPAVKK